MPKAFPAKHGDGREVGDITAQARHFTVAALEAIAALLRGAETEARLRFTVAKFILELGWGRARQMAAPVAETETIVLDGDYETMFNKLMERMDADASVAARPLDRGLLGGDRAGNMGSDGATAPADPAG